MNRLLTYLRRHHLGLLALFIALGGTSYAAVNLPKDSVGSTQIKAGAVGASEVRDGSLTKKDFKSGTLLRGETGATGAAGATGAKGEQGLQGPAGNSESIAARVEIKTGTVAIASTASGSAQAAVAFTSEAYDTGDLFDPARTVGGGITGDQVIRIPKAGIYSVSAGVRWKANEFGMRALAAMKFPSGGMFPVPIAQSTVPANSIVGQPTAQNVGTTDRFGAGDLVFIGVGQNTGASLDLEGSQNQMHLAVAFVGP